MKAIFSPGPSYHDPKVREVAGWVRIFDLYREALEEMGYEVFIPDVPQTLLDQSSTVSKITSYDLVAASQLPLDADLFLGPPGYSLAQIMRLGPRTKKVLWVWNNSDDWRDQQLAEEYKRWGPSYDLSPIWRWINKTALQMANHVIACSPWVKKTHAQVVPTEKISITFWGVDSTRFHPAEREPDVFRVLFVGGDPIRKGLPYLLDALGENDVALRPYEFWVVGCAPLKDAPPHWRQFGMAPFSQMPFIYRQCSVLVCPTLEDGIAMCVQEAMASGLVVVTSPETAEVFEDGVSGIEIPYRDPGAIAQALILLKENPEKRQEMTRAARAMAEQQTWAQTRVDFQEVLQRVMTGGPLPFESAMPWLKEVPVAP